jgi:hypothetical protein
MKDDADAPSLPKLQNNVNSNSGRVRFPVADREREKKADEGEKCRWYSDVAEFTDMSSRKS